MAKDRPARAKRQRAGCWPLMAGVLLTMFAAELRAQDDVRQHSRYVPLHHNDPVGRVGQWSGIIGRGAVGVLQSVKVSLPSTGTVTVFPNGRDHSVPLSAAAQFNVGVGFVYRLKLSDMPELPGVELYPTIEIIDCIHPPVGLADMFPIPISFSVDELRSVDEGRLITKVVYLEQPQLAVTGDLTEAFLSRIVPADRNLLIEADLVGRPMILVRLGGRRPNPNGDPSFFPRPAPFQIVERRDPIDSTVAKMQVDHATTFDRSQPRSRIEGDGVQQASHQVGSEAFVPTVQGATPYPYFEQAKALSEIFPDEYLFDGGDRAQPIHERAIRRDGLDTEDAAAEYADHVGRAHLLPTNRVAIFSPRFGFVRSSMGLETGINVNQLASTLDAKGGGNLRARVGIVKHAQNTPSQGVRVRSRASGFETEVQQAGVHQRRGIAENVENARLVEDVNNQTSPEFRQTTIAHLAKGRAAAIRWTRNEYPVISASISGSNQVSATFNVNEMVGVEDRRTKGKLQILKLADKEHAVAGEIVTFKIRFENLGGRELVDVRIIDNLTPRLEYIEGTASADRPSDLLVEDNGEGSSVLTWTFKDPLESKGSGSVTFKAKVR